MFAGIDSMNDATDTPQVSIQIETSTESLEQINTDQVSHMFLQIVQKVKLVINFASNFSFTPPC